MTTFLQAKARVESAIKALQMGKPVILQDAEDRENEADLIIAAEQITVPLMALFIRQCSGIVCLCLSEAKLKSLQLPQMVMVNESRYKTAFTVSIEARDGVTTGVSAQDRVTTIRAAIAPHAKPTDIVRPGHVFPLRADPGGVLTRPGHTEGSIDLATLAGFSGAAILCELMNEDGTMMRGQTVKDFSKTYALPIVTIEDLVEFRQKIG